VSVRVFIHPARRAHGHLTDRTRSEGRYLLENRRSGDIGPLWVKRSDSKIVSSGARQRTGLVITGPVARWGSGLGGWLEGDFLAGELFELADRVRWRRWLLMRDS
jgi:hypothetical protein